MNTLNLSFEILKQSLSQIKTRLFDTLTGVIGISGIVVVFVAVLSLMSGIQNLVNNDAINDKAYVLMKAGADSELASFLPGPDVNTLASSPLINELEGKALVSKELSMVINAKRNDTNTDANVVIRGVIGQTVPLYDLTITAGRMFTVGKKEIIVGEKLLTEFQGLGVNKTMRLAGDDWLIVGTFKTNVPAMSSEIWTDAILIQTLFKRGDSFSRIVVDIDKQQSEQFIQWLAAQPNLAFDVIKLDAYYHKQVEKLYTMVKAGGVIIALLVTLGALSGLINTIFANISKRKKEIAVLRALGFQGKTITIALFVEILLVTFVGFVIGASIAHVLFNGESVATMNMSSFSQLVFDFDLSMTIYVQALSFTLLVMVVATYFPFRKLMRTSVNESLKAIK